LFLSDQAAFLRSLLEEIIIQIIVGVLEIQFPLLVRSA
jgi:hypothetical protein